MKIKKEEEKGRNRERRKEYPNPCTCSFFCLSGLPSEALNSSLEMLLKLIQSAARGRDSRNSSMTAMFLLSMGQLAVTWLVDVPEQLPERTLTAVLRANSGGIGNSYCLVDRKQGLVTLGLVLS